MNEKRKKGNPLSTLWYHHANRVKLSFSKSRITTTNETRIPFTAFSLLFGCYFSWSLILFLSSPSPFSLFFLSTFSFPSSSPSLSLIVPVVCSRLRKETIPASRNTPEFWHRAPPLLKLLMTRWVNVDSPTRRLLSIVWSENVFVSRLSVPISTWSKYSLESLRTWLLGIWGESLSRNNGAEFSKSSIAQALTEGSPRRI